MSWQTPFLADCTMSTIWQHDASDGVFAPYSLSDTIKGRPSAKALSDLLSQSVRERRPPYAFALCARTRHTLHATAR